MPMEDSSSSNDDPPSKSEAESGDAHERYQALLVCVVGIWLLHWWSLVFHERTGIFLAFPDTCHEWPILEFGGPWWAVNTNLSWVCACIVYCYKFVAHAGRKAHTSTAYVGYRLSTLCVLQVRAPESHLSKSMSSEDEVYISAFKVLVSWPWTHAQDKSGTKMEDDNSTIGQCLTHLQTSCSFLSCSAFQATVISRYLAL